MNKSEWGRITVPLYILVIKSGLEVIKLDLSSLKAVESESISILFGMWPILFAIILGILALGDDKGSLLDKYRLDINSFTLKLATAVSLAALITIPYSSKNLIKHNIKTSVGVTLNDTKYTKNVKESISKKSGDNQFFSSDGYLSIDKDGKVYYNKTVPKKEFDKMKKDGTLKKYLAEGYKEALEWHVADVINNSPEENGNKENSSNSKYDNLTDEEKEKAMELYQRLKEEDANKSKATSVNSDYLIYQSLFDN